MGNPCGLKSKPLKGELKRSELQQKNMNERLALYDLDKKEFSEENAKII